MLVTEVDYSFTRSLISGAKVRFPYADCTEIYKGEGSSHVAPDYRVSKNFYWCLLENREMSPYSYKLCALKAAKFTSGRSNKVVVEWFGDERDASQQDFLILENDHWKVIGYVPYHAEAVRASVNKFDSTNFPTEACTTFSIDQRHPITHDSPFMFWALSIGAVSNLPVYDVSLLSPQMVVTPQGTNWLWRDYWGNIYEHGKKVYSDYDDVVIRYASKPAHILTSQEMTGRYAAYKGEPEEEIIRRYNKEYR